MLAPEYGGDGKIQERCEGKDQPIMAFPAHWAPNALLFYTGNQLPAKYKNGAFICFHGSWNRAPLKQGGYFVAFVPFGKNGKPSGEYEVFAEGFAGGSEIKNPNEAKARPMGLARSLTVHCISVIR
jgi:glucose/arabinose dehydrogenase